jgi:hypothetical protein
MSAKPQPTRFPRPPKTLIESRVPLNIEMEAELTASRLLGIAREADAEIRAGADGLAQLLDPQGRRHIICRTAFAVRWCAGNSDWAFEALS